MAERTVSDLIVERLGMWGVDRVFGYSGDGINGFMGALRRAEGRVEFVQARHEETAAFMAVGHAKYTGGVGVVTSTQGPGAVHLLNGLYDAKLDGVPVVAIVGQITIAVSWAAGTVYVKWAGITGDPVANAAWQVFVAFAVVAVLLPFAEGALQLTQAHALALFGLVWSGLVGSGLAYFLWFGVIGRVPAMTASLGVLSAPVIGVVSTAILLGEWPTGADVVGYVLIFAASACVLLPSRTIAAPEPA
jgi:drug/metabolite transporter (DMT)-like permease